MSDRISPLAVVKDALRTFRRDPAVYLPLILLAMVVDSVSFTASNAPPETSDFVGWVPLLLMVMVNPWLYRRIMHRSIQSLRGREETAGKLWKFILGALAVGIVAKLLSFVISFFPGMGLLYFFDSPDTVSYLTLFSDAVMMIIFLRFGFVLTAIAVDDRYDYSLAWRLGKKHTLRMILTALPCLLSFFGLGILSLLLGGGMFPISNPVWLLAFAASETILVFTIMIYSAWYVRLGERREAARDALATEKTVFGPPPSTDVGPVQNLETWEKV
ncbi:MAG: hypothetical protein AB7D39_17040 [Pseudodesulfovibrio sp.]|uniref:hypothetical protein n=1 Tax=Pseudodesulfovibrio sp. TaxID=2035812 RepID=UPI003D11D9DF